MRECAVESRGRDNEADSSSSEEEPPVCRGNVQQLGKTLSRWNVDDDSDDSGEELSK